MYMYMFYQSKKVSLVILAVTAMVCSRVMFATFNDPEGPNLLIVTVMAGIVYFLSLSVYAFNLPITALKRSLLAILIQVLIASLVSFLGQ